MTSALHIKIDNKIKNGMNPTFHLNQIELSICKDNNNLSCRWHFFNNPLVETMDEFSFILNDYLFNKDLDTLTDDLF